MKLSARYKYYLLRGFGVGMVAGIVTGLDESLTLANGDVDGNVVCIGVVAGFTTVVYKEPSILSTLEVSLSHVLDLHT